MVSRRLTVGTVTHTAARRLMMVAKINICSHTVHGCSHSDAVQVVRANTVQQSQEAVCLGLGVACGDYLPPINDPTVRRDGGDLAEHGGLVVMDL